MKKCFFFLLVFNLFLGLNNTNAQSFTKGKVAISAGYGFGNLGNIIVNNLSNYINLNHEILSLETSSKGPYFGKIEYGINKNFGVGINFVRLTSEANFDVKLTGDSVLYQATISRIGYSITPRFNWHIFPTKKFDSYIGIGLGYRNTDYNYTSSRPNLFEDKEFTDFPISFELTVGAKYMFIENVGIYTELGFSRAIFQLGIVGQF